MPDLISKEEEAKKAELARQKKFADLRERLGKPRTGVVGPPGKTGYWARKNDESELSRLEYLGFHIVHESDPKNRKWKAEGFKLDGTYSMGDVILMEIDTDIYQFLTEVDNVDRAESMISGVKSQFMDEAAKKGVPTFEVNKPLRER